jgi:hypothetical protein
MPNLVPVHNYNCFFWQSDKLTKQQVDETTRAVIEEDLKLGTLALPHFRAAKLNIGSSAIQEP